MPSATLKFNLPEEENEYNDAVNGGKYVSIIQELDNYLRGIIKYEDASNAKEKLRHQHFQEVRDKIHELLNHYRLDIF